MADVNAVSQMHRSLGANVVDRVTLTKVCAAVSVINRGNSADIFVRSDGVDPVVDGDGSLVVVRGAMRSVSVPDAAAINIRLISANSVDYSVECE